MTLMISDVELRGGLVWTDRWSSQQVAQTSLRTLGGLPVFYHAKLHAGENVSLESLEDQGWQDLATVQKLYALAAVPGAQYVLNFGSMQFNVMFAHQNPPAFEATPLIGRTVPVDGDYFLIKMRLITV